jgi:hypothetical protein
MAKQEVLISRTAVNTGAVSFRFEPSVKLRFSPGQIFLRFTFCVRSGTSSAE